MYVRACVFAFPCLPSLPSLPCACARVCLCVPVCVSFTCACACACSDPYMDQVAALRPEVASLYRSDRARFEETAAEWTREYAAKKG